MSPASFRTISSIEPDDQSTWDDVFLTIDVDWACDGVLRDTIDAVEAANIGATWFITHDTPLLARLHENPRFELGIHPNFNFLLNGSATDGSSAEKIIDALLRLVPSAKSVRSHSVTQSSQLLQVFVDKGLTHDCNHFIPEHANIALRPWRLWNGLIKAPYFWEDDLACSVPVRAPADELCGRAGLRIFDIHPTSLFTNCATSEDFAALRPVYQDYEALRRIRERSLDRPGVWHEFLKLAACARSAVTP